MRQTAFAQDIGLGTGILENPVQPDGLEDEWCGDYVYYGTYGGSPVRYRVLDKDSATYGESSVLLDCDSVLTTCNEAGVLYDDANNR